MSNNRRIARLNSLLKEVISEVIRREVKNPHLPSLITITEVETTKDLSYAKVYVSIIGSQEAKKEAVNVLKSAAGFIAVQASKQVVIRHFPELRFILDESVDKQMHIDSLITQIQKERTIREQKENDDSQ